jgi:iron complex outermembrane receptor protein
MGIRAMGVRSGGSLFQWPDIVHCVCVLATFAFACGVSLGGRAQSIDGATPATGATLLITDSDDTTSDANGGGDAGAINDPEGILDLDIDQLSRVEVVAPALDVEVSTVTRTESTVGRSPAAVFVITNEMIRRSGARYLPEVLRLAPGVQVARIDASRWAVSIRGFNGRFANKLLVQIDGRSIYTPLFSGVFWDVQNLMLEDVDRIEVIRGPGAAVWGANAVNGVINVITKKAGDTQGGFVESGLGSELLGFSDARYGGALGDDAHYRVYGKWFEHGGSYLPGGEAPDDWRDARTGFRVDWTPTCEDTVTLSGDYYQGTGGEVEYIASPDPPFARTTVGDHRLSGGDIVVGWSRVLDDESDWSLQCYYDRTERFRSDITFFEERDTLDVDFQHRFPLGAWQSVIWGLGYRNTRGVLGSTPFFMEFEPPHRSYDLYSCFLEDEITLREDWLYFTAGAKFQHNDFTGFEYQPTGRLLWTPSPRHSVWGALSRAVRTPAQAEEDIRLTMAPVAVLPGPTPVIPQWTGDTGILAETVLSYEAGVRTHPTDSFFWDLAIFFNDYDGLLAVAPAAPVLGLTPSGFPALFVPYQPVNASNGETYGFELAANYDLSSASRLRCAYSFLRMSLDSPAGVEPLHGEGESPCNQVYFWLSRDFGCRWTADFLWRFVDSLPELQVDSYNALDIRLAWKPRERLEVFAVGRQLLDMAHSEFGSLDYIGATPVEVQQEVYGGATWRF